MDVEYLLEDLSYGTLAQLNRLDGSMAVYTMDGKTTLGTLLAQRREEARAECSDWRTWNLSAGGPPEPPKISGFPLFSQSAIQFKTHERKDGL